jgi:hypothetical protein
MAKRPLYPLVDMALGGTLKQRLTDHRAVGDSFEDIAVELRQVGVLVSSETVRRWCHDLGLETEGDRLGLRDG